MNNIPTAGKTTPGKVLLRMPHQKLKAKIAKYMRRGKPIHRAELRNASDFSIVETYGSEFRGFAQYYAFAMNRFWLHHLQWVMETSMLNTLAHIHKSTVRKTARRLKAEVYHQGRNRKCLEVKLERPGKGPLIARFGGIRLTTDPFIRIMDVPLDQDRTPPPRSELIARLLADTCELCGSRDRIQMGADRLAARL